ncbi:MAG: GGDEF domain-containing protein [Pseudomonadales bacterium]|nr:GGDEF domain-containing protein [Pseudomonadales bacterium]
MENPTLMIALTLVSIVSSVALFVNWAGNRHIPGLLLIASGFTATSVGVLLLATQGSLPPIISIVTANGLILAGRIPIVAGLAAFWNQEKSRLPVICFVLFLMTLSVLAYFTLVEDNITWRIRSYTPMAVFFSLCNIYLIANGLRIERKLRPVMTMSSNFGAFLALMLFSFNTVTEFILMFLRSGVPLDAPDQGTSMLLLGGIFTMVVFSFAIIIMTMEELSVEHKENAIYDPITTILNHRSFLEVGQRVMGIALRYSKPVSMLTIEVENMDQIVKEHGYKVGNEFLRHFSLLATDRRRNEDVLARSSFKEFRMMLPGVDEEGAKIVIQKIRNSLVGEDFIYRGNLIEIKLNIASVTRREEDLNLQQMLSEGEVELFRVKQQNAEVSASNPA